MKNDHVRVVCEGAVMLALAQILGYLKFYSMPQGGSVTLAMVPLIFFALRWGAPKGLAVCGLFGVLQLVLDGAFAWTWQAMLLDYIVAYTPLGLAGLFARTKKGIVLGPLVGIFGRFVAHTLSGVICWAEYMPSSFLNMTMTSPWVYSPLYNGIYMGLNTVLTVVALILLYRPLKKYYYGEDLRS